MRQFVEIGEAANAVRRFFYQNEADLPEHITKRLQTHVEQGGSPVDLIVNFTESVYANRKALPAEASLIAAGTADLINRMGYHDRLEGRAPAMSLAMRRDGGEKAATGVPWPKADADPAPKGEFEAPAEPEEGTAPPPAPAPAP